MNIISKVQHWAADAFGRVTGFIDPDGTVRNIVTADINQVTGGSVFTLPGGRHVQFGQIGRQTVGLLGDSLSAMCNYMITPASAVRSSNVVTITAASHGLAGGTRCAVFGIGGDYDANDVAITRVDANTISYPSVGPDGTAAINSTYARVLAKSWTTNNSWYQYANSKLHGALRLTGYYGRSSETTTQMLARLSDVVAGSESTIIYLGGSNDVVGAASADDVIANDVAIVATLVASGKRVVVCTIPPLATGHAQFAIAMPKIKSINSARRSLAYQYPPQQVALADAFAAIVDNTVTDGRAISACLQTDKIHLQAIGAKRIGERAIYPALCQLGHVAVEMLTNASYSDNLWPAGQWVQADAGSKSVLVNDPSPPVGAIAGVLDGYNVTASGGAGHVHIAHDPDGYGYAQVAKYTPSGAQTVTIQQESPTAITMTAGAQYRIGFRVRVSGVTSAMSYLRVRVQGVWESVTMVPGTPMHSQTAGVGNVGEDLDLYLMSEPFVCPDGTNTSFTTEVIAGFASATTEHVLSVSRATVVPA